MQNYNHDKYYKGELGVPRSLKRNFSQQGQTEKIRETEQMELNVMEESEFSKQSGREF